MRASRWIVIASLLLAPASGLPAEELSPEETVTHYLTALKSQQFTEAYQYVSKSMARNKTEAEWAKEQQWVMQMTEAKIFEFKIYPAKIEGATAYVPNVLSSQDKYLNQLGVEEPELYTLVREDGRWKITQQQIVEREDLDKWFPKTPADPPQSPGVSAP
ncbi:MAG: hypothetical protein A3J75_06630 [Acidobacteria bacterium RBG_16_68_9]|nr:MAG: hypothetical protein A3J75_06630 [Acidobacteria bacterium RBG_16_68_9]